jgi:mannan endo-1,4-beta-mannosidase
MKLNILTCLVICLFFFSACEQPSHFVRIENAQFMIGNEPYHYLGTNFWYGLNLGVEGEQGNRDRLIRELDRLQSLGVKNLRVMAGSEGPDSEPYRMLPALQTGPGEYNEKVSEGLDFLLTETKKRNMYAVMCLNNFWNWSGGVGQYAVWSGSADSIPYPPPHPGGSWSVYQQFAASFYSNEKAMSLFEDHIRYIIERKNSVSGIAYKEDPTIMSWEFANEPRGVNNKPAYDKWLSRTASFIKNLDPNHLVTTGSEGRTSSSTSGVDPELDHNINGIDYMTIHIWVQNWEIYNPAKADSTLPISIDYAINYLNDHEAMARKIGKPVVLEEFGISRDLNDHNPSATTTVRDKYYAQLFNAVYEKAKEPNSVVAGCNFWAWGGEGRPRQAEAIWQKDDEFIGDPPHEPQGWYSVYDNDSTTLSVIKEYAAKMDGIK